ncbi:hypothetical protein ACVR2T_003059 [Cronobacter malonaticus]|uniref:hypothetical protein n=1 Tax=Cronobacter malonaticus TaxID=413503 RepID=UPI000F4DEF02|nr:hypothetical protein [Cronobacter malonaticus]
MSDSLGYMEYDLSGLKKIKSLSKDEARNFFLNIYARRGDYELYKTIDYDELKKALNEEVYMVLNNEPRRKGKQVFFTGNAAQAYKKDILDFIKAPVQKHDLIVPLLIVPLSDSEKIDYFISTQEDPVFEIMKLKKK